MSYSNLFESINYEEDQYWVIKEYLNTLNDGNFYDRILFLANGKGQSTECAACIFPDDVKDEGEEVYDGIFCCYFDDNIVVAQEKFKELLKIACERYLVIHQNSKHKEEIKIIINKI
jgi:CDI immunity protein